jgi:hypothetical protein
MSEPTVNVVFELHCRACGHDFTEHVPESSLRALHDLGVAPEHVRATIRFLLDTGLLRCHDCRRGAFN